jgi:hypothetical protein
MRSMHAGAVAVLCAVGLTACQDGPLAPRDARPTIAASLGGCADPQPSRAGFGGTVQSFDFPPGTLIAITVTATFNPLAGLPWGALQQMQFPLGYGADRAPCLNTADVSYQAEAQAAAAPDPVPVPAGVDAEFWNSLSPREQRVLLKVAEDYLRLNPGRFPSVGAVINNVFKEPILRNKADAKVRANDFFGGNAASAEQMAGGIYGCQMYRELSRDHNWFLSNDETLRFVIDLVTAFAEAEFAWSPLRGLQFGRNGAFGAAMAQQYSGTLDCGQLVFNSIPDGRIRVTDPSPSSGPPSGGGTPSQPPQGGLPPGWYDY